MRRFHIAHPHRFHAILLLASFGVCAPLCAAERPNVVVILTDDLGFSDLGCYEPGAMDRTPTHLVDLLPTVAELAGAEIPTEFPGREPTPLAGVSLVPILSGEALENRPPIHFLFDQDRGLRDGDWKIVSFRAGPWELYDLKNDPAEVHNVAAEHPERVERMAAEWHRMTRDILMAPEREQRPVESAAKPKLHPHWSNYDPEPGRHTGNR